MCEYKTEILNNPIKVLDFMISIYRDEICDLLNHNRTHEAEDIWMQLLEDDPLDHELFLAFSQEFEKKGFSKEASLLLNMSIPHLLEEEYIDETFAIMKRIAQLAPHDEEAHAKVAEYFRQIYKDFPELDKILAVSGIEDTTVALDKAMETVFNLTSFQPGDFCKHKSWGMGQIVNIDYDNQLFTIDFYAKKNHKMDIVLAVTALENIPTDHISALKYKNLDKLKKLAEDDPVELIKIVLRSFDENKATLKEINDALCPDVIDENSWKKWWDKTKNILKTNQYIISPEKKQKSYLLLDKPMALEDKMLKKYSKLDNLPEKLTFISTQLKKQPKDMFAAHLLDIFADDLATIIGQNADVHPSLAFEAYYTMVSMSSLKPDAVKKSPLTSKELLEKSDNLAKPICDMSKMEYQKQALADIKTCFPDRWAQIYIELLKDLPYELIDDVVGDLKELPDTTPDLERVLLFAYDFIGDAEELLFWMTKNLWKPSLKNILTPFATIGIVEKLIDLLDLHNSGVISGNDRIVNKITDIIKKNNYQFITKLLKQSNTEQKVHVAQTIMGCSSLDKTSKQSIIAKFIIDCPEVKNLMKIETTQSAAVYSSQKMFEKKQDELYRISNVLIPQNARDINTAREHGDLRENFEFKAAKEEQARLLRMKEELEDALTKIRIIDYSKATDQQVSIATTVHLHDLLHGNEVSYSILGVWDTDPDKGVISYLTPLAKELIGKKVGDEISFSIGKEQHQYKITGITPISSENW